MNATGGSGIFELTQSSIAMLQAPERVEMIRKIIKSYVERPLDTEYQDSHYLLAPDDRPAIKLDKWVNGLESVFGWIAANPAKQANVRASELLYVHPPTGAKDLLNRVLDAHCAKDVFVVGDRGSGKSIAQNTLINEHFSALCAGGYTFFRADVAKLHESNVRRLADCESLASRMGIAEYMALHAFFVALEHAYGNSIDLGLARFGDDASNAKTAPHTAKPRTSFQCELASTEGGERLLGAWGAIERGYRKRTKKTADAPDEDLYTFLDNCRSDPILSVAVVLDVFKAFLTFIASQQYVGNASFPCIKVILIVDGADNLRTDEFQKLSKWPGGAKSRVWYEAYLTDIRNMIRGRGIAVNAEKMVFALRGDTFRQLDGLDKVEVQAGQQSLEAYSPPLHVTPPNITVMFKKKRRAAREEPGPSMFNAGVGGDEVVRSPEYSDNHGEVLDCFDVFVPYYFKGLTDSLKACGINDHNPSKVSIRLFKNNIRSASRNAIRSFQQVFRLTVAEAGLRSNRNQRLELFEKNMEKGFAFESSVAGGNEYFMRNSDDTVKGRWCPNLFEYDSPIGSTPRWDGLVTLRILAALPEQGTDASAPNLKRIQEKLRSMRYSASVVEAGLQIARHFGLVSVRDAGTDSDGNFDCTFERTLKGDYIQKLPFTRPAVLYRMGTGCRFREVGSASQHDFKARAAEGWLHSPDPVHRHLWPAALKTGSHLLRHIHSAAARDKQLAGRKYRDIFDLPNLGKVMGELAAGASGLVSDVHAGPAIVKTLVLLNGNSAIVRR